MDSQVSIPLQLNDTTRIFDGRSEFPALAKEDLVRRRYNKVLGIDERQAGWREGMQAGIRNTSSVLEYLRQKQAKTYCVSDDTLTTKGSAVQSRESIEMKTSLSLKSSSNSLKRNEQTTEFKISHAATSDERTSVAMAIVGQSHTMQGSPLAKERRNRRKSRCALHEQVGNDADLSREVFPSWLCHRDDFRSTYSSSPISLCFDAMQKLQSDRVAIELIEIRKWMETLQFFRYLPESIKDGFVRSVGLQLLHAGEVLYKHHELIHHVYVFVAGDIVQWVGHTTCKPPHGELFGLPLSGKYAKSGLHFAESHDPSNNQYRRKSKYRTTKATRMWALLRETLSASAFASLARLSHSQSRDGLKTLKRMQSSNSRTVVDSSGDSRCYAENAKAGVDTVVLSLAYDTYCELFDHHDNLHQQQVLAFLKSLSLFYRWSYARIERFSHLLLSRDYKLGDTVFRQGDPWDFFFFVLDGKLSLSRRLDISMVNRWPRDAKNYEQVSYVQTRSFEVDVVSGGDYYGEHAIMGSKRCPLTVTCSSTRSTILFLRRRHFVALYDEAILNRFKTRISDADEFRFFKIFSSLKHLRNISNLLNLDVFDSNYGQDQRILNHESVDGEVEPHCVALNSPRRLDPAPIRMVGGLDAQPQVLRTTRSHKIIPRHHKTLKPLKEKVPPLVGRVRSFNRLPKAPVEESLERATMHAMKAYIRSILDNMKNPGRLHKRQKMVQSQSESNHRGKIISRRRPMIEHSSSVRRLPHTGIQLRGLARKVKQA